MSDNDKVWIVGRSFWQLEADGNWSWTWDFHGAFRIRENATALCKDQHWFIIPIKIDRALPDEPFEFTGLEVPNETKAEPLRHERGTKEAQHG